MLAVQGVGGGSMEFRILGPMEVLDGARVIEVPTGRARALLAMLVLHAGEVMSADRLVDELWAERPPATAATVVQGLVSRLRRELEPGRGKGEPAMVLQTVGTGYRLVVDADSVDANRFKRLVGEAQGLEPDLRAKTLGAALRLWRGPALADFVYDPFAQTAIAALDELRLVATQERIAAELGVGNAPHVLAELEQLVADHPLSERLRALQMLALYQAGRQAEALEVYRRTRDLLLDELGVEPGPELQELEGAVLRHDPSLRIPSTPPMRSSEQGAQGWIPRERRLVTVVGLDLTPTGPPASDPEAVGRAGAQAAEIASEVLRRYGARVEPLLGHMMVAFFGFPAVLEDHAVRAVHAALEVRDAVLAMSAADLPAVGLRLTCRTVVETGDIVLSASGGSLAEMVSGPAIDAVYRLQRLVGDDEVVLGPRARILVRGHVLLERVGDMTGADPAWRAVDVLAGPIDPGQPHTPLVGRVTELSQVRARYRLAVRDRRVLRYTVVGEAGIGKSRLAAEVVESLGNDVRVLRGRCASYGQGLTYLPLREALSDVLAEGLASHLGPEDAEQIAAAVGLASEPGNVHSLVPAVARLLTALAADKPLVVVLDDLHWAEPTFLDLVDQLVAVGEGPVLLLCLGRPDLMDERPQWATGDLMVLGPLEPSDTEDLVELLIGSQDDAVTADIVVRSQGNPLFAEQLLAAVRDEQSLDVVPASLRGLLAGRLDRLGPGQRDLLRSASVVGPHCPRDALSALLPADALPYVDRHLDALELKRLVTRSDGVVRFVHVLVQLAAYGSMTLDDRARLHEAYGLWLRSHAATDSERDELVGYHLEQTIVSRRAMGTPEADLHNLAQEAGERLADAAARALGRVDETAAHNLLSRALALLPPDHPRRGAVAQDLADINLVLGRFGDAQTLLHDLAEASEAQGDTSAAWSARLENARVQYIVGPTPLSTIVQVAEDARAFYRQQDDEAGQGRAAFLLGCAYERQGRLTLSEQAFRTSLSFADRAPNMRERMATRWMIAEVLTAGPTPVRECLREFESLELPGFDHPGLFLHRGMLVAMQGRYDDARAFVERARTVVLEEMHVPRMLVFVASALSSVELLAGDRGAAEQQLRETLAMARWNGEPEHIAPPAARLALLLRGDGRLDEANELALLSAQSAHEEDAAAHALSRTATALLSLSAGDSDEALAGAEEAVSWAPDEMLNLRADVLTALVEVMTASGRSDRAAQLASEADDLYRRKGRVAHA